MDFTEEELKNEQWAVIQEDDRYEISTLGRCRNTITETILVPHTNCRTGYVQYVFSVHHKCVLKSAHRLVAKAFIPNPENKPCVNHLNEIRDDNRASNLQWMTYKENNNYGHHNENVSKANKGKIRSEEVKQAISRAKKGMFLGTHWFNNGKMNLRSASCPIGFVPGRIRG